MKAMSIAVDISPNEEVELGASDSGGKPWGGVAKPLEANLLALANDDGSDPILIVSLDLLYPGRIVRTAVELAARSLPKDRVFVAASHTHRAPMTDDTKPLLGSPSRKYMEWLTRVLSVAVAQVLTFETFETVIFSAAQSSAQHSINRRLRKPIVVARRPRMNAFVNAPNAQGEKDETLLTASVRRMDGTPIAILWNYACHPVGDPAGNAVSAHFPGVVRTAFRSTYEDSKLPVLFFQGFSGNTRPSASARPHSVTRRLRQILVGPLFEDMTPDSYAEWSDGLAKVAVENSLKEVEIAVELISTSRAEVPGSHFAFPSPEAVSFHRISFGQELSIVGMSGEVVAEYAPLVRQGNKSRFTFCVGCTDHTFGYVPTSKILREGGYEAGGFRLAFGIQRLNPAIETNVLEGFAVIETKRLDR